MLNNSQEQEPIHIFCLGFFSMQISQAKFMQNKLVAGRKISPIYFLQKNLSATKMFD
mgnify:CR=1 FL=1